MDDSISRQAAIDAIDYCNEWKVIGITVVDKDDVMRQINVLPTIEERKTGKWIETNDGWDGTYFVCSNCGCPWTLIDGDPRDNGMNYCPNCGSKMEGEK